MAQFTDEVALGVRKAISSAAGVQTDHVRILSVGEATRRRLLQSSIALDIAIDLPAGETDIGSITPSNLNQELTARGLPEATILEPPILVYLPIVYSSISEDAKSFLSGDFAHCVLGLSWPQLVHLRRFSEGRIRTGGLGRKTVSGVIQTWVCDRSAFGNLKK